MSRLENEWNRLFVPEAAAATGTGHKGLVGPDGLVRVLIIELGGPPDWRQLAPLWQSVQADLDWPAPAIAVNGRDAFQLWIALSAPIPAIEARAILGALHQRYLTEVKPERVVLWPSIGTEGVRHADPVPQEIVAGERWSAFVAPDLAAVFGDDPALDFPPGADSQADVLARIRALPVELARSLLAGGAACTPPPVTGRAVASSVQETPEGSDPAAFLLSVMNDASVAMSLRIEAAKALLGVSASRN